jgi:hypothetical protein
VTLWDLLILGGVVALFGRLYVPWAKPAAGIMVGRVPLSLLARLRLHARPAALLLAFSGVIWLAGWLPPYLPLLVVATLVLLFALPAGYTLTGDEIALGRTPARRWMEFGGVARQPGGVRLQGVAGAPGMTVWLSGRPDDDDFVLLLRLLVRGSYKGQLGTAPPRPAAPPPPISRPPERVGVTGG